MDLAKKHEIENGQWRYDDDGRDALTRRARKDERMQRFGATKPGVGCGHRESGKKVVGSIQVKAEQVRAVELVVEVKDMLS